MITHILCVLNQSFLHVTVFICYMNTVTAPLTPHTTQGTDMDAETSKAKPQPWPPSPEAALGTGLRGVADLVSTGESVRMEKYESLDKE